MSSSFSQLGASFARLSSMERRFIILVAVILFLVINLLFVLPHFTELSRIDNRFGEARTKLDKYEKEIAQIPFYEKQVKELEGEGASVPREDQAVSFLHAIQTQAAQSGVQLGSQTRQPDRTNAFFIEKSLMQTAQSGESQLVDFLYNLGEGNSLIRVRALTIRPDQPRQALSATVTLVASFQKAATTRAAPAAKSAPAALPTTKPAASATVPVTKTNPPAGTMPANKPSTPTKK